jgi:hypothetical protein
MPKWGAKMSRFLSVALTVGLVLSLSIASVFGAAPAVNAASGGPDGYGYRFTDSNEAGGPSYSWEEISGSGTALTLGGDSYEYPVSIGFSFDFYGVSYTELSVCSDGGLTFGDWGLNFINQPLPDGTEPFIAVYWDDLTPPAGSIYYETLGSAPNRTFVVEWDGVASWSVGGDATFEIILYEGTNNILMQYDDTIFGSVSFDEGASSTVGIQQDDSNALQYSYNEAVITTPLAILFYLNDPPDIPTLNSPSDGETDIVLTPDLVFDYSDPDDDDCASFDLQVDDDTGFGSPEIDESDYSTGGPWSSGSSIIYTVSTPLAPDTQYYWRVNVSDGTDWSGWSDGSWDFTTGTQSGGSDKNEYKTYEDVYVSGTGFPPNSDIDVYVVEEGEWSGGETIADYGIMVMETFTADSEGDIVNERLWRNPLIRGEYDVVFDAGQDGVYDEIPDLVDHPNHPGFTVVKTTVGGEVYPVDKTALLLPWLGLSIVLILATGGLISARRAGRLR